MLWNFEKQMLESTLSGLNPTLTNTFGLWGVHIMETVPSGSGLHSMNMMHREEFCFYPVNKQQINYIAVNIKYT